MDFPHLPKAPITEAVIDLRARLAPGFDVGGFRALKEALPDYPHSEERQETEFAAELKPGKAPLPVARDLGITACAFRSADRRQLVQFGREGFSFHRLALYTTWKDVFTEAMRLWGLYAAHASPLEVTRIAVRYINQIKLPLPPNRLEEFLTAPPQLPPDTELEIDGFLTRFAVRERGSNVAATIIQASKGSQGKDHLAVLLDVDAFERGAFASDGALLTERLGHLRELKNRIFFRSITDKTKALFQ